MSADIMKRLRLASDENITELKRAKSRGRGVVGFYCLYSPTEMAIAANAIPLPLCGTREDPIEAAEKILPRNLCPLIKSSFGFAVTDSCPFFRLSDIIIGDTTCDGKKKMFELLAREKTLHVLQLPQTPDTAMSLTLWRSELERFKGVMEEYAGVSITEDRLRRAIRLMNRERAARKAVMDANRMDPAPISGSLLLEILFKTGFFADKEKGISFMEEAAREAASGAFERKTPGAKKPKRILLTGVPVGMGSDKVVKIVEKGGADVVAFENCSGYKQAFQVDEQGDPMDALARQYLATPCSVMSPNTARFDLLGKMIEEFRVDGVIDLTWRACHTYNVEAFSVEAFTRKKMGVPSLHLETDYSQSDFGQLEARVDAYLEMLG